MFEPRASGSELLLDVEAPLDEPVCGGGCPGRADRAASIVRGYDEHEVARLDEALLSALTQTAGPGDARRLAHGGLERRAMVLARSRSSCSAWSSGSVRDRRAIGSRRSRVPPPEWPDRTADLVRDLAAVARRVCGSKRSCRAIAVALPTRRGARRSPRRTGMSVLGAAGAIADRVAGRLRRRCGCAGSGVRWIPAAAARAIEAARPSSRNVVITAEELLRHPERAAPSIRARVLHESAEITGAIDRAEVVPLTRPAVLAVARAGLRCERSSRECPGAPRASAVHGRPAGGRARRGRTARRADGLGDHRSAGLHARARADGPRIPSASRRCRAAA